MRARYYEPTTGRFIRFISENPGRHGANRHLYAEGNPVNKNESSLGPAVLSVEVSTPERVVYVPVPEWVIEDVWQGEVTGSFRFLSEAQRMLEQLSQQVFSEELNAPYFAERQPPRRRE